jgi:hypothetical protein
VAFFSLAFSFLLLSDHEVVLAEELGENETGYEGGEGAA